ncbi:MAG: radical SAM protein [Phycisphaerae bacterium]|nr:radical SAM protein [Phycisphaerae bacterium]
MKHLIELTDHLCVEAVWIPQENGVNLCISCQVGCPNKCRHCATGTVGFERDLSDLEIIGEVGLLLAEHGDGKGPVRVLFMGMGEPFLNYENVISAVAGMVEKGLIGSAQDAIVSTSGIASGIQRLATEKIRPRLAVTIAAVPDEKRVRLIPTTKFFPLADIMSACRHFQTMTQEEIICEIPLIDSFNSSVDDAHAIADFLSSLTCEIQIVPFNHFPPSAFRRPDPNGLSIFTATLKSRGMKVAVKPSYGTDIAAGCGQLANTDASSPSTVRQ